jgi:hypothetical protein
MGVRLFLALVQRVNFWCHPWNIKRESCSLSCRSSTWPLGRGLSRAFVRNIGPRGSTSLNESKFELLCSWLTIWFSPGHMDGSRCERSFQIPVLRLRQTCIKPRDRKYASNECHHVGWVTVCSTAADLFWPQILAGCWHSSASPLGISSFWVSDRTQPVHHLSLLISPLQMNETAWELPKCEFLFGDRYQMSLKERSVDRLAL